MGFLKALHERHEHNNKTEKTPYVAAVIVAAGKGERMQSEHVLTHETNKLLMLLCGIPVIARTLSTFEECHTVDEIVVVTNPENIVIFADIIKEFGFAKVKRIVRGGATRQLSALEGLKCISEKSEYIAIHDGARPLISPYAIDKTVLAAIEKKAAAAAVKVKDTIKLADNEGIIIATPERASLWAVQTPQVFSVELYRKAFEKALQENADYTDDCQLVESIGKQVQLVESEYTNIKITTRDDVIFAESIIRARGDAF
jgi:2-C-methyl-D-erythritol 4-phosphate cytidylyltransferase